MHLLGLNATTQAMWGVMREYKANIMRLRRGNYFFDPKPFKPTQASRFIGYQISHIVLGYLVCFVIFTLFATFTALCYFWSNIRSAFDTSLP